MSYLVFGVPRKPYNFRLSEDEINALDRVAAAHHCTRTNALRWLIIEAGDALENQETGEAKEGES